MLLTVAIVTGIINEGGSSGRNEAAGNSRDDGTSAPSTAASNEPEPSASSAPAAIALTPESNAELAALLQLGNICDDSIAAFAEKYKGAMIAFDGSIGALNNHNGATTRYDLLLGAGDFSETSAPGPAFQYRDVNLTNDLHYVGVVPDTIGVGTNLRVTAEVDEYEPNTCLFLLEPVETSIR
ncbi:DUF4839 domain-containing protein [Diaminobutyricimonas aerilata]|uniref:DUF4839 domain-containing protein n=1 Tax=Diaminobutyricimonas aerilata TaxID=1162967 RepID=UPI0012FD9839|nr:DUF4839 domain-containing protein [Diaminobutyricimonas aerilata]